MRTIVALVLSVFLASSALCAGPDEPFTESATRRYETVFFISLPFTSLYSGLIVLGFSAIVQKGNVKFTVPYQAATIGLAVLASGWMAWEDHVHGGPDLREVERVDPAAK
jgi:hypothetical protein